MYGLLKGMGYAGAHISGHGMVFADLLEGDREGRRAVARWQELVPEFDYPQNGGWYFFEPDKQTGLNRTTPVAAKGFFSRRQLCRYPRAS